MAKTYRRFSNEFKLGVVEAYLAADGQPWRLAAWVGEPRQGWWRRRLHIEPMTLCAD